MHFEKSWFINFAFEWGEYLEKEILMQRDEAN